MREYSPFHIANFNHSHKLDDRQSRFTGFVWLARASRFDALIGSLRSILFDYVWTHRFDTPAEGDRSEFEADFFKNVND